jgi:hypothetical protein
MGGNSLDHLAFYLAMVGFDFEVREPVELTERIRRLAQFFSRAIRS